MTPEASTSSDTLTLYFKDLARFTKSSKRNMADMARQLRAQKEQIAVHLCGLPSTFKVLERWYESGLKDENIYKLFEVNSKTASSDDDRIAGIRENALQAIKKILELHHETQSSIQKADLKKDLLALSLTPAAYDQLIHASKTMPQQTACAKNLLAARRAYETTRAQMINQNLHFAAKMAKSYMNRGLAWNDLIQEGNIGLIKAVEKYDPDMGYTFFTYAKWWIKASIERAFDTQLSTIRLPQNVRQEAIKAKRASLKFIAKFGRSPTPEELALEIKTSPEKVRRYLDAAKIGGKTASLDEPISDTENPENLGNLIKDTRPNALEILTSTEEIKFYETLLQRVAKEGELDAREADIVSIYHLDPDQKYSLTDIAKDWGLSSERIRQLESRAMKKLRLAADSGNFPSLSHT